MHERLLIRRFTEQFTKTLLQFILTDLLCGILIGPCTEYRIDLLNRCARTRRTLILRRRRANTIRHEFLETVVASLIFIRVFVHHIREFTNAVRTIFRLIIMHEQTEEGHAPTLELLFQHIVLHIIVVGRINVGMAWIQELRQEWNDLNTTPSTTVHRLDLRHSVRCEEHLT